MALQFPVWQSSNLPFTISSAIATVVDSVMPGWGNDSLTEPESKYNIAAGEVTITGRSNSIIILGRDRVGSPWQGKGGSPYSHCAAIDIIAGIGGRLSRSQNSEGNELLTNKNTALDSARVYLTQLGDIDAAFNIASSGARSIAASNCSGVVVKADAVRLVGRQNIKLVTGTDTFSAIGSNAAPDLGGVELIGGNDPTTLEPMVMGDKLVEFLRHVMDAINAVKDDLVKFQLEYIFDQLADMLHVHFTAAGPSTPPPPNPTKIAKYANYAKKAYDGISAVMDVGGFLGAGAFFKKMAGLDHNYLSGLGKDYILSRYHKLNTVMPAGLSNKELPEGAWEYVFGVDGSQTLGSQITKNLENMQSSPRPPRSAASQEQFMAGIRSGFGG